MVCVCVSNEVCVCFVHFKLHFKSELENVFLMIFRIFEFSLKIGKYALKLDNIAKILKEISDTLKRFQILKS